MNNNTSKKLVKIAKELSSSQIPRVYVGTYGKYNDGNLKGEWVDLNDFYDYDDFIAYCKEIHSDQQDPEIMFQDYENFPSQFYGESGLKPELWDYIDLIQNKGYNKQDIDAILEDGHDLNQIEDFFIIYGYTDSDIGQNFVNEIDGGIQNLDKQTLENYFDYESYGRDIRLNSYYCVKGKDKFYIKL